MIRFPCKSRTDSRLHFCRPSIRLIRFFPSIKTRRFVNGSRPPIWSSRLWYKSRKTSRKVVSKCWIRFIRLCWRLRSLRPGSSASIGTAERWNIGNKISQIQAVNCPYNVSYNLQYSMNLYSDFYHAILFDQDWFYLDTSISRVLIFPLLLHHLTLLRQLLRILDRMLMQKNFLLPKTSLSTYPGINVNTYCRTIMCN